MVVGIENQQIYEILISTRAQETIIQEKINSVKAGLILMDQKISILRADIANQSDQLYKLEFSLSELGLHLNLRNEIL